MNKTLLNNRPKDASEEEFEKVWNNSGYALEALYKTLEKMIEENNNIRKDDFDCPNHYARLSYQAGFSNALSRVLDMLPPTAKP